MSISKKTATALWTALQANFLEQERILKEIIRERAWEPIGYSTFAEAWKANMSGITLAKELRPHVVYQLLAEDLGIDQVAEAVKGVGPEGVAAMDRQRRNGLSPDLAKVSEHLRRKPSPSDTLHIKIGETMLAEYRRIAKAHGLNAEEIAKDAIADRFAVLVAAPRKRTA